MSSSTNGLLTTDGSGSFKVTVVGISMGLQISMAGGEAKRRRVAYPQTTISSSFSLGLVFRSWEQREKFNVWMQRFMERTVDSKGFKAAMRVDVPVRRFSRTAIPQGPIDFGESIEDVIYQTTLDFVGASDPLTIGPDTKRTRSYFAPPARGAATSRYFYPAGVQLKGAGNLDGATYDNSPTGRDFSTGDQVGP